MLLKGLICHYPKRSLKLYHEITWLECHLKVGKASIIPKLEFCLFSLSFSAFLVLLKIKWVDNLMDHVVQRARDSNHPQLSIAKPRRWVHWCMLAHCGCDQTPNFGTVGFSFLCPHQSICKSIMEYGNATTFITLERILATEKIKYIAWEVTLQSLLCVPQGFAFCSFTSARNVNSEYSNCNRIWLKWQVCQCWIDFIPVVQASIQ